MGSEPITAMACGTDEGREEGGEEGVREERKEAKAERSPACSSGVTCQVINAQWV